MAYRLIRKDASVESAVRRIAREQIDAAVQAIDDPAAAPVAAIHELRKYCKKVRGLLRLVRPTFADYATENAAFRDIARGVSPMRDADVLIATYDDVVARYADQVERPALGVIRRRLMLRRKALASGHDPATLLAQCRQPLLQAAERAGEWRLDADGFAAMHDGLRKTYRRARKAMRDAKRSPSPDNFHAWRKRCKDHWYHARLLRPIWPEPMRAHADCAGALGDVLGGHHDLAVFGETLAARPGDFGNAAGVEVMVGLVRSRLAALEADAFALGARLLAEAPSALASSWCLRYEAWHAEAERPGSEAASRHLAG